MEVGGDGWDGSAMVCINMTTHPASRTNISSSSHLSFHHDYYLINHKQFITP